MLTRATKTQNSLVPRVSLPGQRRLWGGCKSQRGSGPPTAWEEGMLGSLFEQPPPQLLFAREGFPSSPCLSGMLTEPFTALIFIHSLMASPGHSVFLVQET